MAGIEVVRSIERDGLAEVDAFLDRLSRATGHPTLGEQQWLDLNGGGGAGFLAALTRDADGGLAGFCWTKLHDADGRRLGEIYVIAVDPDFEGRGLGRELVLAGLDSLWRRGAVIGTLYVDGSNARARRLYERLGFTLDHVDRVYVGALS